jgi:diguanylate cyclase
MNLKSNEMRVLAAGPEESQTVLDVVADAIEGHEKWLQRWHRAIVCGAKPDREIISDQAQYLGSFGSWFVIHQNDGLLNQPVFKELGNAHEEMHEFGRFLALRAADDTPIPPDDYEAFVAKVNRFNGLARRIRDAFQQASNELDPLPGLHNRKTMIRDLERERDRALRTQSALCIALADIDHFKSVNDTHGHGVGDTVLQVAAGILLSHLRPYDSIYRYGGEEFLLCLPNADALTACRVIDRLRVALRKTPIPCGEDLKVRVTASFGLRMVESGVTLKGTIEQADQALYAAKRGGRDRSVLWTPEVVRSMGA